MMSEKGGLDKRWEAINVSVSLYKGCGQVLGMYIFASVYCPIEAISNSCWGVASLCMRERGEKPKDANISARTRMARPLPICWFGEQKYKYDQCGGSRIFFLFVGLV